VGTPQSTCCGSCLLRDKPGREGVRLAASHLPVQCGRHEDTAKGNRPSFGEAARPEEAEPLYEAFCEALRELGVRVETGSFGVRMAVDLVNDGPVTIVL